MRLAPGIVVADRFQLERLLGQGGMGGVWRALQVRLGAPCAVKFMNAEVAASPELRARFEREARAAAQIRSPNVVQILDHGVWDELPYIAMELLEGEDLAHRLRRQRVLAPREVLMIAAQVGRALSKAHAAGVVHRDLKPGNIFLARDDDAEVVKILDFGVAKENAFAPDTNTKTGSLIGTPFYMSPEQARGNRTVDGRSDLWALAVVVFQCLTGKLPFHSDAIGDLLVKIIVDPPPVPSQVAQVPPGFDAWWARAAAREPSDRFQTAKELTEALGVALGVGPTDLSLSATPMPALGPAAPASVPPMPSTPVPMSGTPMPAAPSVAPPTPTPAGQAMTLHPSEVAPPVAAPSRRNALIGAVAAGVVLGSAALAAVVASVGSSPKTSPAAASAPVVTASAAVSATPTSEPAPPAETAAPAPPPEPVATAAPAPPETAAPAAPSATPSAAPAPTSKPRTGKKHKDFGI